MLLSGGGAQSAAAMGQGASVDTGALASTPVFQWNMNVADRTVREIQPVSAFGSSTRTEWVLESDNVPGRFIDLARSKIILRATVTPVGGACTFTPILNSALFFKNWQVHVGGVNVSEQNQGYDWFGAFHKACLTRPRNQLQTQNTAFANLQGTSYEMDRDTAMGFVTPPATHDVNGSGELWSQSTVREIQYRYQQGQNGNMDIEIHVPHPLFHQGGMIPSSFQIRICAEIIDATYNFAGAFIAGGESLTVTPTSCNFYASVVELTAPGLKLYNESLLKNNGDLRLPCFRSELAYFTLPQNQTVFNFSLLGKRVPNAVAVHFVPQTHLSPATKPHTSHPLEETVATPIRVQQLRVRAAGKNYPRNWQEAVLRDNTAPYHTGQTVAFDNESYRHLCRVPPGDKPFLAIESLQATPNLSLVFINMQENGDAAPGTQAPMPTIGPLEFTLSLFQAVPETYVMMVSLLYNDVITVNPVKRAVMPGW